MRCGVGEAALVSARYEECDTEELRRGGVEYVMAKNGKEGGCNLRRWVTEPNGGMSGRQPERRPWQTTCSDRITHKHETARAACTYFVLHVCIEGASGAVLVPARAKDAKELSDTSSDIKEGGRVGANGSRRRETLRGTSQRLKTCVVRENKAR